ncbi:MAG TPA: gfo/Idh/MocA family oxidoreductase, partial [bacterium]|nr:gfo/Idh/MocA family oxidoreductase [bacterium]
NWHWHWDYGNGDIGNQGVHQLDVARWGLGVGLPSVAQSLGGHFMFQDDQETPNTLVSTFKYPEENKMMVFEVRHWITNPELGGEPGGVVGNLFLGSKGIMIMPSYTSYQVFLGRKLEPGPSGSEGGDHFQNFIDCVRSRKVDQLNADVEEGHLSSALAHLANTAYRVERTLKFDPVNEKIIGDPEAEQILNDQDRKYRAPFSLPETV